MKKHPTFTMIGGVILAAWIPFWSFLSTMSNIDLMRSSGGQPSIGTFFLPRGLADGLTLVGFGVMVYPFILLSGRIQAGPSGFAAPSESGAPLMAPAASKPEQLSDILPPPVTIPGGRAIHSCSVEQLAAIHTDNTTDQASRLLVGKWVKFDGEIYDNAGKGRVSVRIPSSASARSLHLLSLQFGEGWEERLSTLRRGSRVTVRGQIVGIGIYTMEFEGCELL